MSIIKKSVAILGVLFLGCIYGANVNADFNIGTSIQSLDTSAGDFRSVNITLGYDFTDLFGVRTTYMLTAEDESLDGVKLELTDMFSADLVLTLPLSDSFNPYLFAGRTYVEGEASYRGYSLGFDEDYTTYGIGLIFAVRESFSVYGEGRDVDGDLALSFGFKFEI